MSVLITKVDEGSLAERKGVLSGDLLLSINSNEISDVLDYRFHIVNKKLKLRLLRDGKERTVTIRKDELEDIGLDFETYLMDKQQSCRNKCIFCFIDQLPKGLRESLYFKDDDSRMSFLFGNYITLTNISEHEVDRIIKMHISPINVSVHTTNPELRVRMMKNRHAGEALDILYRLAKAGTKLNCQLVLCPDINDGAELERSLADLTALYPSVQSVAVVPVGITKYREGLEELKTYTPETAAKVLDIMERVGDECLEKYGTRLVYASDEFYLKAGRPLPDADFYEEFAQLENGVGMCTLMKTQFAEALEEFAADESKREVSIATGLGFLPLMREMVDTAMQKWHNLDVKVYGIVNDFFGHDIDVSGLVTGRDLIAQLKGKPLGERLLLPSCMFRSEGDLMLDDISKEDIEQALNVPVRLTANDGYELLEALLEKEEKNG